MPSQSRRKTTDSRHGGGPLVVRVLLLAVLYFGLSRAFLSLAIPPGYATPVWPGAGIAVAAVLMGGWRYLPGIWLGSLLTNLSVGLADQPFALSLMLSQLPLPALIALGAALGAWLGAELVRRTVGYPGSYDSGAAVGKLLGYAGPVACLFTALWGSFCLRAFGVVGAQDHAFTLWTWWVGDTLGVLLFLPASLLLFGQPRSHWNYRLVSVGLPLLISFVVAVMILYSANRAEEAKLRSSFERDSARVVDHLRQFRSETDFAVHNLAARVANLPEMRFGQFLDLVQPLLQSNPELALVQWLPRVERSGLEAFTERTRQEELPDYLIKTEGTATELLPVLYQAPIRGQEQLFGRDFAAVPSQRATLVRAAQRAAQRNAITYSGVVRTATGELAFCMFAPVYPTHFLPAHGKQGALEEVRGFIHAVVPVAGLIREMRDALRQRQLGVRLLDVTDPAEPATLFATAGPASSRTLLFEGDLNMGGRAWRVEIQPTPGFVVEHRSVSDWTVLASALGVSGLLGAFLLIVTGRMFRIESAVSARTANLNQEIFERQRVEEALRASEARYRNLAFHDSLTGLANREFFSRKLVEAIQSAMRGRRKLAVHFFDLDHFKDINDAKGHPVGDELLCRIAELLKGRLRASDTLARLGGDEFAILQPQLRGRRQAADLAERTIAELVKPLTVQEYEVRTSTSVGIAFFDGAKTYDKAPERLAVHLMEQADIALYEVKERRRGTYAFHTREMSEKLHRSLAIGHELKRVLDENSEELSLAFQPQVRFSDGRICAFEALLRWNSRLLGQVNPADFVAIAEARGLISDLGRYTLRQVCRVLALTKARMPDGRPFRIAVNISVTQFTDPAFVDDVIEIVSRAGVAADRIELEVTEAALARSIDQVQRNMRQLRDFGVSIAIDDFGTGYSSLLYLKRMPVQRLKVAQEFVRDMLVDPADAEIVRATIQIAKAMDLELIAEGVETEAHARHLQGLGCELAQGYYFYRPLDQTAMLDQWGFPARALAAA